MALGNTPNRLTNIYLEAKKSFALNIRFTNEDGSFYDVTGAEVRLVATPPASRYSLSITQPVITLEAVHIEPTEGLVQVQFQASDLDLVPGEYPFDVTLVSVHLYSTPILKGLLVVGQNADPDTSNMYTNVDPDTELKVVFGNSCDVVVCLQYVNTAPDPDTGGGGGTSSQDTTWTLVGFNDPGNPTLLSNPGGLLNTPLWIDLSESFPPPTGGGGGETPPGGDLEWILPELTNGWVGYSVGTSKPVGYRKLSSGLVILEGTVSPGRSRAAIFTFPPGYRPNDGRLTFNAMCETGLCQLDLMATGELVLFSDTPGAWVSLSDIVFYGEEGSNIPWEPGEPGEPEIPPEEEEDMYGEHIITWTNDTWVYRGNVVVARPATIPAYALGSRAVWDTSLDETVTTPPVMAIVGDVWFPHGDVDPLA